MPANRSGNGNEKETALAEREPVAPATPTIDVERMGKWMFDSSLCPRGISRWQDAALIIQTGLEIGIKPSAALRGIHVIKGMVSIAPQLMLGLIYDSGQLEDITITDDGKTCSIVVKRKGREAHTETFSADDAQRMGLTEKDNWVKMPAFMRRWRCVAAMARIVFPDIIGGLYTHEEIRPDIRVTQEGEIDVTVAETQPEPTKQMPQETRPPEETPRSASSLPPRCPKCGTTMHRKHSPDGKYEDFWGCPNYPKCKGTRNIGEEQDEVKPANGEDEPSTKDQRQRIGYLYNVELGQADRDKRLADANKRLGLNTEAKKIHSSTELTKAEASRLIDHIEKQLKEEKEQAEQAMFDAEQAETAAQEQEPAEIDETQF